MGAAKDMVRVESLRLSSLRPSKRPSGTNIRCSERRIGELKSGFPRILILLWPWIVLNASQLGIAWGFPSLWGDFTWGTPWPIRYVAGMADEFSAVVKVYFRWEISE